MTAKKIILMVFLLFALNFSFQPNTAMYAKEKHTISFTIDVKYDKYTEDFISEVNKQRFVKMVSLAMSVKVFSKAAGYNTS